MPENTKPRIYVDNYTGETLFHIVGEGVPASFDAPSPYMFHEPFTRNKYKHPSNKLENWMMRQQPELLRVIHFLTALTYSSIDAKLLFKKEYDTATMRGQQKEVQYHLDIINQSDIKISSTVIDSLYQLSCYMSDGAINAAPYDILDHSMIVAVTLSLNVFFASKNITYTPIMNKKYNTEQYWVKVSGNTVWATRIGYDTIYDREKLSLLIAFIMLNEEPRYTSKPLTRIGIFDPYRNESHVLNVKDIDSEVYNTIKTIVLP